jgi:hypothetical protein
MFTDEIEAISRVLRLIKEGQLRKFQVDGMIDDCGTFYHVKDILLQYREKAENARNSEEAEIMLRRAARYLGDQNYFSFCFCCF